MENEDYNGWVNRETWLFNLWLNNDQGIYGSACEAAKQGLSKARHMQREFPDLTVKPDLFVGEALMKMMTEIYDDAMDVLLSGQSGGAVADTLRMFVEIGSCWRVDLNEIGSAWVETAEEVDA
jgi:hypothetical protein